MVAFLFLTFLKVRFCTAIFQSSRMAVVKGIYCLVFGRNYYDFDLTQYLTLYNASVLAVDAAF
jgi:hypothetical protein